MSAVRGLRLFRPTQRTVVLWIAAYMKGVNRLHNVSDLVQSEAVWNKLPLTSRPVYSV